jgi:hypothetical protein
LRSNLAFHEIYDFEIASWSRVAGLLAMTQAGIFSTIRDISVCSKSLIKIARQITPLSRAANDSAGMKPSEPE